MKRFSNIVVLAVICLFMLVPGYAKAAGKNQSDVAKLKKIVNEQIKKGADLSGGARPAGEAA